VLQQESIMRAFPTLGWPISFRRTLSGAAVAGVLAVLFTLSAAPDRAIGQEVRAVATTSTTTRPRAASVRFDDKKYADERQTFFDPDFRRAFPRLGSNFEVLAPPTPDYNCISYSLGIRNRWVNPETGLQSAVLSRMDKMYGAQGYRRLSKLDLSVEPGKQKVAVYMTMNPDGTLGEVTHAAVQQRDGTWTSKLGRGALIRHRTPEALRGAMYGLPVAVYVRSIKNAKPG
jgi:hypothetical protein